MPNGNCTVALDDITDNAILALNEKLSSLWNTAESAISVVQNRQDAIIQCGLFGLVNDLDTALKIGFLMGDRVVLIDYLYERILRKKQPEKIDRQHLAVLASFLVSTLPLAEGGRIVIIPNPLGWNSGTKELFEKIAEKGEILLTPDIMSMINMLSLTESHKLHPYTIAESEQVFQSIVSHHLDATDTIGRNAGTYAYSGILGGLLSEKLFSDQKIDLITNIPLNNFVEIISAQKEFYHLYLTAITSGGSINAEHSLDQMKELIKRAITLGSENFRDKTSKALSVAGIAGSAISLVATTTVVAAPLAILGAMFGLGGSVASVLNKKETNAMVSVFAKLISAQNS